MNEGHVCVHIGYPGPGEPPEDDEITLPPRHRIRNSNPGIVGGRARYFSVTEALHNIKSL